MLLKALSTTFGLPWGLDLSQLGYPALYLCSVMVIEWLGLPLGVKFPLVPKIQAGQKCQFSALSLHGTIVMPKKFRLGRQRKYLHTGCGAFSSDPGVQVPSKLRILHFTREKQNIGAHCHPANAHLIYVIDCIDYITRIGNAHAHNGVHSMLRLGYPVACCTL